MRIVLKLEVDKNPEYGAIMEGYNNLMKRWNELNNKLHGLPEYMIYLPKRLQHHAAALLIYRKPKYKLDVDEQHLSFQHFQSILLDRINHFRTDILLIESNYNLRYKGLLGKRDFNIAIASFGISLIGLFAAILK